MSKYKYEATIVLHVRFDTKYEDMSNSQFAGSRMIDNLTEMLRNDERFNHPDIENSSEASDINVTFVQVDDYVFDRAEPNRHSGRNTINTGSIISVNGLMERTVSSRGIAINTGSPMYERAKVFAVSEVAPGYGYYIPSVPLSIGRTMIQRVVRDSAQRVDYDKMTGSVNEAIVSHFEALYDDGLPVDTNEVPR